MTTAEALDPTSTAGLAASAGDGFHAAAHWRAERERAGALTRRLVRAIALLLGWWALGTVGFLVLAHAYAGPVHPGSISGLDALYFTTISITTIGYGDNLGLLGLSEPGRTIGIVGSIVWITVAYTLVVYASSTFVAWVIEGSFSELLIRRKMEKRIASCLGHIILAGVGGGGETIVTELHHTGHDIVIVDADKERILGHATSGLPDAAVRYIVGDATDDAVLLAAGVERAHGLIATLANDRDNLFVVLSARQLNPSLRLVARATDPKTVTKLEKAGADAVVSTNFIGAMRLASEMVRPAVVSFLDEMLRDSTHTIRVEAVAIPAESKVACKSLAESGIFEHTGLTVIAYQAPATSGFRYNPAPDTALAPGAALVVIGRAEQVAALRKYVS